MAQELFGTLLLNPDLAILLFKCDCCKKKAKAKAKRGQPTTLIVGPAKVTPCPHILPVVPSSPNMYIHHLSLFSSSLLAHVFCMSYPISPCGISGEQAKIIHAPPIQLQNHIPCIGNQSMPQCCKSTRFISSVCMYLTCVVYNRPSVLLEFHDCFPYIFSALGQCNLIHVPPSTNTDTLVFSHSSCLCTCSCTMQ